MNAFIIAFGKTSDPRDWTLLDATASGVDPLVDIVPCTMTKESLKVVMRFHAPSWVDARRVFNWKAQYDRRVPKHLLTWEEARLMLEPQHAEESQAPQPRAV